MRSPSTLWLGHGDERSPSAAGDPARAAAAALRDEMLQLHQAIDAQLRGARQRVIQFTAARAGEGTTTVVRAYGHVLAEAIRRSVLIVDTTEDPRDEDVDLGDDTPTEREPNLSIVPISARAGPMPSVFDAVGMTQALAQLRTRYDTILVDASPASRPGAMAMAARADGVVLVVEAEQTRWPVALAARRALERSGATVLGVVLNKRRYYIPEPLYRWL
jgi:Mrp family chromosome partitioning ATPase